MVAVCSELSLPVSMFSFSKRMVIPSRISSRMKCRLSLVLRAKRDMDLTSIRSIFPA